MKFPEMKVPDRLLFWQKPKELDEELLLFETALSGKFTHIEPDSKFVINLRNNLLSQFPLVEIKSPSRQHKVLQAGLIITGGILGSAYVLLTGVRGFVSLIGIVGLLISWFKQNSQDTLGPPDLAH